MNMESVVKVGLIGLISAFVINCGGGGGGSKGGVGGGNGGSSSSSPSKSFTVQVRDGQNLKSYTVAAGEYVQHHLDTAYSDLVVQSVQGCAQSLSSVQTRYGGRDIQWHPTSDCTLEIIYEMEVAKGNFVTLNINGYGSRLSNLGVDYIFVNAAQPLHLPLGLREGYTASADGCGGRIDGDRFVIDAVTENCAVDMFVTPTDVDNARTVTVNYSGETGGRSGSEVLLVAEWKPADINVGNSLGFVPAFESDCGTGSFREDWGVPNARLVFNYIVPESCTVNIGYSIAEGRTLVAYAAESDQYRTYVSSFLYDSALVNGTHIALSQSEDGVLLIVPNPGYSISNVKGCKADNDLLSIHMRTAYMAASFGSLAHGVSDCPVIVDVVDDKAPAVSNMEIVYAWDRPSNPKAGNITIPRLATAWTIVDVKQLGVNESVSIGAPEFPTSIAACDLMMFDEAAFLIPPGIGRTSTCGVELKKR